MTNPQQNIPPILLTGVCGSGKTTLGSALAAKLNAPFLDADDFHPPANLQKMAAGIPLNDADRAPWLAAIAHRISQPTTFVLACSALKEAYRTQLRTARADIKIFHLTACQATLRSRLLARESHFMPAALLNSQLETLEASPHSITIDTTRSIEDCIDQILSTLAMQSQ